MLVIESGRVGEVEGGVKRLSFNNLMLYGLRIAIGPRHRNYAYK